MSRKCMVAGCKDDAVMRWAYVTQPMLPAGLDVCERHIREALGGAGRLRAMILATLDVTSDGVVEADGAPHEPVDMCAAIGSCRECASRPGGECNCACHDMSMP